MNRRRLLAFIGLAPVASCAPMPVLAAAPRPLPAGEFIVSRHKARLYGRVSGVISANARPCRISRHVEFANGEIRKIGPDDRVVVIMEDESSPVTASTVGIDGDCI